MGKYPDFLIIAAHKSTTTTVHETLSQPEKITASEIEYLKEFYKKDRVKLEEILEVKFNQWL